MDDRSISLYREIDRLKGKIKELGDQNLRAGQLILSLNKKLVHSLDIESKAAALLHLPFSATEAFEKARKELLEVICKK